MSNFLVLLQFGHPWPSQWLFGICQNSPCSGHMIHTFSEAFLANYFDNNGIKYEENFIVNVPKEIRPTGIIKIDFYLPEYNTFIEYNGKQHYIM